MQEMVDRKMFLSEAMGWLMIYKQSVANYQTKQIMIWCHQQWAPILQCPGLLWLVALALWRSSSHPLGRGPGGWLGFLQRLFPGTSRPRRDGPWWQGCASLLARPQDDEPGHIQDFDEGLPTWVPSMTLQSDSARWHGFNSRLGAT